MLKTFMVDFQPAFIVASKDSGLMTQFRADIPGEKRAQGRASIFFISSSLPLK